MTSPSNLRDQTSPCFPYLSKTFKIAVGFTFPLTFTVPCSASRTTEYTPFRFCNTSIIFLLHPSQWTFTLIIQLCKIRTSRKWYGKGKLLQVKSIRATRN
uniref:Uncharacterized protein n=1 Tax=Populus davidiana TaxID=266767 RepID=A0A6M2ERH7_9ROSI